MWVLELLLVAYLPGALCYRLPWLARDRRASYAAEERVFWAVLLSVAWSSVVALGLAAASRYTFATLLGVNGTACVALLLIGRQHLLYNGTAVRPSWHTAAPIVLIAIGAWLYFPVSEYLIGGKDPGVYVNEGVALAQRGSFTIDDGLVATVPPLARDIFFPAYGNPTYYSSRFMGFFLVDPITGSVSGQFPHLYPAWIAIGYGLRGLEGALSAIAVWAILGLLAVYFAWARLVGRLPAFAGTVLLAVSLVTVWFARYPNSEVLMQALLFAALLAFARAHVDDDRFFAPVAGVLSGLLLFLRFDAVVAWATIATGVVLLAATGRRPRLTFLVPAGASAVLAWLYYSRWLRPYFQRPLEFVKNLQPWHLAALVGAVLVLAVLLLLARRPRVGALLRQRAPVALVVVVVTAAVYAYFFRQPGGRLAAHDAASLRTFTWYFPWPALVAAVLGFSLVTWKRFWRDPALLLTAAGYALFVFYKLHIVPDHLWMTRRFLPVILPAMSVLCAAGSYFGARAIHAHLRRFPASDAWKSRALVVAVPTLFLAIVAGALVKAATPVRQHVEYDGITAKVEALARRFSERDLVIVEARRSSDLHVVALPLAYIYAKNVLVLATPRPDRDAFADFIAWARRQYDQVYFAGSGGTDLLSRRVAVVPVASEQFHVPEYENRRNEYPVGARYKEFDFSLYRFIDAVVSPGPLNVDIGRNDDLYVVRFHAKELDGDLSFRWTTDVSYVTLVGLDGQSRTATVWLADGGRDVAKAGPAVVALELDGHPLGRVEVKGWFRPYTFDLPATVVQAAANRSAPALLKISSTTFNPGRLWGHEDNRTLGVMVDRVEVQ